MDYEQKYKEALGWMQSLYDGLHGVTKEDAKHYFPELVEDEKIKNEIIAFLRSKNGYMTPNEDWHFHNRWLAWLEKQGEQPVDKIEPKFKVGDWVVKQDGENFWNGNYAAQITNITDRGEHWFDSGSWLNAKDIRLWTIDDAKDGDVLVDEDNNIGLYSGEKDDVYWHSCIYLGCDNYLRAFNIGGYHKHKNTKPATKEQHELLFSKMKQEGYEWDVEKKELRKIDTYQLNENPCSGCTNTKGCITCVNGDQKSTSTPRMLYSDDVIGWLCQHTCTACFDKPDEAISLRINKFKEDFGL